MDEVRDKILDEIEEIKELIPDGSYLKIMNLLKESTEVEELDLSNDIIFSAFEENMNNFNFDRTEGQERRDIIYCTAIKVWKYLHTLGSSSDTVKLIEDSLKLILQRGENIAISRLTLHGLERFFFMDMETIYMFLLPHVAEYKKQIFKKELSLLLKKKINIIKTRELGATGIRI